MKFQFKIEPWAHQRIEFEASKDLKARALLWQMRTGKTKVVIDTAAHLFIENKIDAVLIVTRSGVHSNWVRKEIPKHCPVPYDAEWWDAERYSSRSYHERLHELLTCESLIFFAVNNESFIKSRAQSFINSLLKLRVMLVVDEVHDFRKPGSKRSRLARQLAKHCIYRRTMTGTNNGNCPLGNWAQFEILSKGALGYETYGPFEREYATFEQGRSGNHVFKILDSYQNLEKMQQSIDKWASTITRRECPDLPPLVTSSFDIRPSNLQRDFYRRLKRDFEVRLNDGSILTAEEAGVRRLKLQQVLSNFMIDESGQVHTIDENHNTRLDGLMIQLEDAEDKVIVWCRFKKDISNVASRLRLEQIEFVEYHGDIGKEDRFQAETKFKEDPDCKVFLGQPQAAGLGLDLSAASTIVWYSHTDDIVVRDQANERATEKGASSVAVITLVVPDSVDEDILSNLNSKTEIIEFMDHARKDWRQCMLESLERDKL